MTSRRTSIELLAGALLVTTAIACSNESERTPPLLTIELVADAQGGLVDVQHPEFGAYPNPREVDAMTITLSQDGQMCGSDGQESWCGGPVDGIPHQTRAFVRDSEMCIRVYDVYGNRVDQVCGSQLVGVSARTASDETEPTCWNAVCSGSCEVCLDENGMVISNTCDHEEPVEDEDAGDGDGDPGSGSSDEPPCVDPDDAVAFGAELVVDQVNEYLERIGLETRVSSAIEVSQLADFDELELHLDKPTCASVVEYLDDEFSDDHEGTDDYLFGPEAMAECLDEGSCRIGQLVTRAMAAACLKIPENCDGRKVGEGIVSGAGECVQELCEGNEEIEDCVGSPLVLDLNGDGLALRGLDAGVQFSLMAGGAPMSVGWVSGGDDALLAIDLDEDGVIADGRELFGEASSGWAADGFAALGRYDHNADGRIDASDPRYHALRAWKDDGNATTEPGELIPLSDLGVASISLRARENGTTDPFGNLLGLESSASLEDGRRIQVTDVWFRMEKASTPQMKK